MSQGIRAALPLKKALEATSIRQFLFKGNGIQGVEDLCTTPMSELEAIQPGIPSPHNTTTNTHVTDANLALELSGRSLARKTATISKTISLQNLIKPSASITSVTM
jgi:hypothetical protein